MKKTLSVFLLLGALMANAQFNIKITPDASFSAKEAYFYTLSGSRDILVSKEVRKGNSWSLRYPSSYVGMMKVYFPENNASFNFISENKDINVNLTSEKNKIKELVYADEANALMNILQADARKQEVILPALLQMKGYYTPSSEFSLSMDKEIARLSKPLSPVDASKFPFISFFMDSSRKYLSENKSKQPNENEIIDFLSKADNRLETSSLIRPLLLQYVQTAGADVGGAIDRMLKAVIVESPRGQVILSETIDMLDAYGMATLKDKYLSQAKGLKCTITDRLASTIRANNNTEVGAKFLDYKFVKPSNTKAKSIYDLRADKKVIVFWSSTCSHCEAELPKFIAKYNEMKAKNIEIIGLSVDNDKVSYENRIKDYPWVNDSELKGWYSSYVDTYNVRATPTFFILDAANKIVAKPDSVSDVFNFLGIK